MKKLGIYLFFLLPLMSCNDWLNVESEESVTYQSFFKSEQDVVSVINGMFISERREFAFGYPYAVEYAGLYCDKLYFSGFKELNADRFFGVGVTNSHGCSWSGCYNLIYFCNLLEENRYRFEGISEERADFWLAQANFMKALAFFRIAQLWGDAPVPENSYDLDPTAKNPVKEVLNEAVKTAEKALILPVKEQLKDAHDKVITSKQYASLGTVYTLLANIYAWRGGLYNQREDWEKAEEYATLVVGDGPKGKVAGHYQLENNVADLVTHVFGSKRSSDEIIFGITYSSLDHDFANSPSRHSFMYPGFLLLTYPHTTSDYWKIEKDFDAQISVTSVKELYGEEKDTRRKEYWYKLGEVEDDWGDILPYAYIHKWREMYWSTGETEEPAYVTAINCDKVIWRLADLKLLRAECRARLGKADAVDDLNDIRKRAGLEEYKGVMDSDILRREIFKERERELFGEGHRYYDAVRNGVNPRNNFYLGRIAPVYTQLSDADIQNGALYMPVNDAANKKNPYMKQNTYWLWRR